MTTEEHDIDYVKKYRDDMSLNIYEKTPNTDPRPNKRKAPKGEWKKYQNEVYDGPIDIKDGLIVFCGRTSNNLLVVDLDDHDLLKHFSNFIGSTFIVKTGKKGYHLYFRTSQERPTKHLENQNKQKIDLISNGGIIVLPPSIHPETNKPYEIISDQEILFLTPDEEEIIYDKIKGLGFIPSKDKSNTKENKQGVNEGNRNRSAFDLAREHFRDYPEEIVMELMIKWNQRNNPPLPDYELETVVNSAKNYPWIEKESQEPKKEKTTQTTRDKDLIDITADMIKKKYDFVTVRKLNEILMYDGKIYSKSDAESIIKEDTEVIIPNCTTHERNEVVNKIKAQTGTDIQEFDKDVKLMTLLNGILDFDTLGLNPHTPQNLSRVLLPIEYNEPEIKINDATIFEDIEKNLKDTLFWKFLKSSFTIVDQEYNDLEFRKDEFNTVLEVIASFFVKHQIDEKAFMFLGRGENGKSVLLEYIESVLGKDNKESIPLQLLSNDKFMASKLVGKLANIFSDLESDELRHTGVLKAIISGEGLTVQEKYKEPFTLYPFSKMLFSCNRFPKSYDQGQGFFRRWIIVKWERNFEGDPNRDEHLKDTLKENQEEKNKVFSCLIHLTRKLLKDGKFSHSKDWKTIMGEWNANADPIEDFISKCIEDSEEDTPVREVYAYYKHFMQSKQETPLGIAKFGKEFKEVYDQEIRKENKTTRRVWVGVKTKKFEVNAYD